jgi:hypothetical protein
MVVSERNSRTRVLRSGIVERKLHLMLLVITDLLGVLRSLLQPGMEFESEA